MNNIKKSLTEVSRELVRRIVPKFTYILLSSVTDWICAIRKLGYRESYRLWRASRITDRTSTYLCVRTRYLLYPFFLRPATTDISEFLYTIARETYGKYLPDREVQFILDAGANTGDTTAYLLTRYQNAKAIAVEPDPDNFSILQRNCAPYGTRILLEQCAVWPEETSLTFISNDAPKDAIRVCIGENSQCLGKPIQSLMKRHSFPRLDVFKCDIEGAEQHLFSRNADEWLLQTQFIIIETHGTKCFNTVMNVTKAAGFKHRQHRNILICERT